MGDTVGRPVEFGPDRLQKQLSVDHVRRVTEQLSRFTVEYYTKEDVRPRTKYARTLAKLMDKMSDRHRLLFKSAMEKLEITELTAIEAFRNVMDRMFEDNNVNWGRIVTVFTFAGHVAKMSATQEAEAVNTEFLDLFSSDLAVYIELKFDKWIRRNGGWDGMVEFFKSSDDPGANDLYLFGAASVMALTAYWMFRTLKN